MIDRVPGRWNKPDRVVKSKVAFDDLGALGFDDREYRVDDPGHAFRIVLMTRGPMSEFAVGHDVGGLGKSRHPAAVLQPRVPADMVRMQMRAHHVVDVADRDASRRQRFFETVAVHHVPRWSRRTRLVISDAGIDENIVMGRLYEEALDADHQPILAIDKLRLQP